MRLEAELWFFGASFGLLIVRSQVFEPGSAGQEGSVPGEQGESDGGGSVRIEGVIFERLPGFGRIRLFRIRHIRGGILALR